MAEHGTRTRFNQGCTDGPDGKACDACREANNNYFRQRNRVKTAEKMGVNVTSISKAKRGRPKKDEKPAEDKPNGPGPMEIACLSVLSGLERAKQRPDLAEAALALARDIDLPLAIAQRNNLVARYQVVMDDLARGSEKRGRLAAVRKMTRPDAATG